MLHHQCKEYKQELLGMGPFTYQVRNCVDMTHSCKTDFSHYEGIFAFTQRLIKNHRVSGMRIINAIR